MDDLQKNTEWPKLYKEIIRIVWRFKPLLISLVHLHKVSTQICLFQSVDAIDLHWRSWSMHVHAGNVNTVECQNLICTVVLHLKYEQQERHEKSTKHTSWKSIYIVILKLKGQLLSKNLLSFMMFILGRNWWELQWEI